MYILVIINCIFFLFSLIVNNYFIIYLVEFVFLDFKKCRFLYMGFYCILIMSFDLCLFFSCDGVF